MKRSLLFAACLLTSASLSAQQGTLDVQSQTPIIGTQKSIKMEEGKKEEKHLIISGYFQSQFQHGQRDATPKVGGANEGNGHGFSPGNEISTLLKGFESDKKDNVLTYRIQYKF